LPLVDERLDVHRVVGLDPHGLEIALLDDDVFLVLVFVALDEVRPLDQPAFGVDRLHVDAVVGVLVQLVERDAFARAGGRIKPDRTAHEAQFEVTLPASPGRHVCLLRDDTT
jgi:hypothetical protein